MTGMIQHSSRRFSYVILFQNPTAGSHLGVQPIQNEMISAVLVPCCPLRPQGLEIPVSPQYSAPAPHLRVPGCSPWMAEILNQSWQEVVVGVCFGVHPPP